MAVSCLINGGDPNYLLSAGVSSKWAVFRVSVDGSEILVTS